MSDNQTEDLVRLATEVMGWRVLADLSYVEGAPAFTTDGTAVGIVVLGQPPQWNPFEDANADVQVLERVRDRWNGECLRAFARALSEQQRARYIDSVPKPRGFAPDTLRYIIGDHARAALAAIDAKGE